ncbi:MAG: adenylosuccinate lyase [Deltaproteobacteria bacterium]|nr:adenylosuccinate lyase [Deltaproteobacteria bacterium]
MIERYSREEMKRLWTDAARFELWFEVERLATEAMVGLGEVPEADYRACVERRPTFDDAAVARIFEIEETTRHDVIAFLTYVEEQIGEESRWLHLGMTSSDVLDTAFAVQLCRAADLLLADLDLVLEALERLAKAHRMTPMIGRSHGIHAEPTTFGLVVAGFYEEFRRHRMRLKGARAHIAVGKVSGAVGTFAHLSPAVEDHVCRELGLVGEPAATQVVARDRHAELFSALAGIGSSIERVAVEIRHLQRTEVGEAQEPFRKGQKGSSAMPHKRNPILSENLTGLARLLRSYAGAALENVALWHQRDISHSSVERVIAPDATIVLDFALHRLLRLMSDLVVHPDRMMKNLESTGGMVFSQTLLLALAKKGLKRQEAYVMVQRNAMAWWDRGVPLLDSVQADPEILEYLSEREIEAAFDLERQLGHVDDIFARVFGE